MLSPAKVKYRKRQKGRILGQARRGSSVVFGEFGLMALESGWITQRQIEAARIAMTRHIKRGGRVYIEFFQISQSLVSRLKLEWVKVKALQMVGLLSSSRAALCTKCRVLVGIWQKKRSVWRLISFLSRRALLPERSSCNGG